MTFNLTYPTEGAALVVGGSGGVGSVICETLAKAGVPVAFTYNKSGDRAKVTAGKLQALGQEPLFASVDGRDAAATRSFVDAVVKRHGCLHTVVYAGGPLVEFTPLADASEEQWMRFMAADAGGVFNLASAVMPHLRKVGRASFTSCVTFANRRVLDLDGLSAAPKAAVESLVRQIAAEEGKHGVRANSVGLGWIDAGMGTAQSDQSLHDTFGQKAMDRLLQSIRLGRPGTAQELANVAVFLASDQASYVTGQAVMVDGGGSL